jgi:N-acetylglutamate synthase-like GNAT family acetyltransferase
MMKYILCENDELATYKEQYKLELDWENATDVFKLEIDGEIVGLIEYAEGFEKDSIHIHSFEVLEKGKGIGGKIIGEIINDAGGYPIYLYANGKKSQAFWEKHHFKSLDDGSGETKIHRYASDSED